MKQLIIDTDCGVDDAVAIMIALASAHLEVLGITTVNGNVGVGQVTENVLRLLPYLGRERIPVFRGASRPLYAAPHHAAGVHGANGLGGVELPDAGKRMESAGAAQGMVQLARDNPGSILVALGPLTNVAIALNLYPELEEHLAEIVCMGGAVGRGNVTEHAEFNFYADPEAVKAVLDSRVPLAVVPWDAALKMAHSEQEIRALGLGENRVGRLLLDMHQPLFAYIEEHYGARVAMFPDPIAVAWAADPGIAVSQRIGDLTMEPSGSPRRGASLVGEGERARLIMEIDKVAFQRVLLEIQNLA